MKLECSHVSGIPETWKRHIENLKSISGRSKRSRSKARDNRRAPAYIFLYVDLSRSSATTSTARLGVSRRADALDEEIHACLRGISSRGQRSIGVSHQPGERFLGGLTADGPFSTVFNRRAQYFARTERNLCASAGGCTLPARMSLASTVLP